MSNDSRPQWDYSEITEAEFRRFHEFGQVKSVEAVMKMTGVDTSREWLVATNANGKKRKMPIGWKQVWEFKGSWSVPGLFGLTWKGRAMANTLQEIDKWEAENAADRAEYERLKEKFEGAAA